MSLHNECKGRAGDPEELRLWVREWLREALGSSREGLGIVSECFGTSRESLLGFRESVGSGQDAKVKIIVFLKDFVGF